MITPELVQKLKEAGFPETTEYYGVNPTLSDLIEACGEEFGGLERRSDGMFIAIQHYEKGNIYFVEQIPEIAVAKLWLALNKK